MPTTGSEGTRIAPVLDRGRLLPDGIMCATGGRASERWICARRRPAREDGT